MNVALSRQMFIHPSRLSFGNFSNATLNQVKKELEDWAKASDIDLNATITETEGKVSRLSLQANVPQPDNLNGIVRQTNLYFRLAGAKLEDLFHFDINGKPAEEIKKEINSNHLDPHHRYWLNKWYIAEDIGA